MMTFRALLTILALISVLFCIGFAVAFNVVGFVLTGAFSASVLVYVRLARAP
jgi:hypothetical protein